MIFDPVTGEVLPEDDAPPLEERHPEEPPAAPAATAPAPSGPQLDFGLYARDAAEYLGEALGLRLSTAAFRRMVLRGDAPAPVSGRDNNAQWSQASLEAWATERTNAEADEDGGEKDEGPKPVHTNVYEFFDGAFAPYYELHDAAPNAVGISASSIHWCPKWWMHRDVVGRLTAAWYAWETAHADGGASMSSWILEHADRHHAWMMSPDGPFRACKQGHQDRLEIYPTEEPPEAILLPEEATSSTTEAAVP